jgi:ParB family chromosome partitioning protein
MSETKKQPTDPEEVLLSTLNALPDVKLTEFALRLVSTGHTDTPRENDFDFLAQAEAAVAPSQPKKKNAAKKPQPVKAEAKSKAKKEAATKKAA